MYSKTTWMQEISQAALAYIPFPSQSVPANGIVPTPFDAKQPKDPSN